MSFGTTVPLEKAIDQIRERAAAERAVLKIKANNVHAADPGEVDNRLLEAHVAEHKPRVAFVGDSTIGLQAKPGILQDLGGTVEMQQFVLRPALPMPSDIGQARQALTHLNRLRVPEDTIGRIPDTIYRELP